MEGRHKSLANALFFIARSNIHLVKWVLLTRQSPHNQDAMMKEVFQNLNPSLWGGSCRGLKDKEHCGGGGEGGGEGGEAPAIGTLITLGAQGCTEPFRFVLQEGRLGGLDGSWRAALGLPIATTSVGGVSEPAAVGHGGQGQCDSVKKTSLAFTDKGGVTEDVEMCEGIFTVPAVNVDLVMGV